MCVTDGCSLFVVLFDLWPLSFHNVCCLLLCVVCPCVPLAEVCISVLLFAVCCMLFVVCCMMFVAYCLWLVVDCSLIVVCRWLSFVADG